MAPRLTIGAVFRRETRYLREWLEFHLALGVDRFYLFNHDRPEDRPASDAVLAPYVAAGLVVNTPLDLDRNFQLWANDAAVRYARADGARWVAVIDLDEFLFPVVAARLPEALAPYEADPGLAALAVWLRTFGTSGLRFPPMLQTEAFVRRAPDDHPANFYRKYVIRCDRVDRYVPPPPAGSPYVLKNEDGTVYVPKTRFAGPADVLRINHYATRSAYDWRLRVERGLPAGGFPILARDLEDFFPRRFGLFDRNEVEDTLVHRFLPTLKRRMGIECLTGGEP